MTFVILTCGVIGVVIACSLCFRKVRRQIARRFRYGKFLIRGIAGFSLVLTLLSFGAGMWLSRDDVMGVFIAGFLLCMMGAGVIIVDRLHIISQPAINRRTYLVVAAHPGDVLYGAAATLAKLRDSHHEVHVVTLTNGCSDDDVNTLPEKSRSWAQFIGCSSMILGNMPVEKVAKRQEYLREFIREQMEKHQPEVILTHSPNETDPERALVGDLVTQVNTRRQTVFGFQSPTTNGDFSSDRRSDVKAYMPMKEYILRDYHRTRDARKYGACNESFEVIHAGCTTSL